MFEWTNSSTYWLMFSQVIITLIVVPMIIRKNFIKFAHKYGLTQYPKAADAIAGHLDKTLGWYRWLVLVLFCLGFCIVAHAAIYQLELFDWDDQAGLNVLLFIALLPVFAMNYIQSKFFSLLAHYNDGKRSATLKARGVWDFLSKPMIFLVLSGQLAVIASVIYFLNNPFHNFGGWLNLLGLAFMDAVFIISIYFIMNNKRLAMIKDPNQRIITQQNAINFNVIIWIVALYYLCISLWVMGLDLAQYKIYAQILYFHFMFLMVAYISRVPKSFYQNLSTDAA